MKKTLIVVLCLVMLLFAVPIQASAESSDLGMPALNGQEYQTMTTSQSMIDMIKDFEGFHSTPYWDVSQWTVGYGTCCGTDYNNKPSVYLTESEAEELLRERLDEDYGAAVNNYCKKIGRQPTQNQFDALVDFTYNLGTGWLSSNYRLNRWLENPTTEMELVGAMGAWCRVDGDINYTIAMRRVREAIVFLHGEYYLCYGGGDFESELSVVSNHDLPYYKMIKFRGNGGSSTDTGKSDAVEYYKVGEEFGWFSEFENAGYELNYWEVTAERNASIDYTYSICESDLAYENLTVRAVWMEEGTKPTEPEVTEPAPTEPEVTEPEVTEPEVDEPVEPPVETVPPVSGDDFPFVDVPNGAWYRDDVQYVYDNGYMNGVSANYFEPDRTMNRGMLVTVLYRIAGTPDASGLTNSFADVPAGSYYADAITWAKANGIVNGVDGGSFEPEEPVTRQDAVTIFFRYCDLYAGMDCSTVADLGHFDDLHELQNYAREPMAWAVAQGLVNGCAEDNGVLNLHPVKSLIRAEGAALLHRFVEDILA